MTFKQKFMQKTAVGIAGFALIGAYFFIFFKFFPITGGMGHDFALILPQLLDGYFWFRNNGLGSVFWFSPFLCGGVPAFAHPVHFFYSVPQFLSFLIDPYFAVVLNFFIFAALGFWGCYFLFRRLFSASVFIGLFCATLFLFNGFYTYRYIIGHTIYHSFMLIPWCVLLLTDPVLDEREGRIKKNLGACTVVALMFSYMVHSTLQTLMPCVLLSIVATCFIYGIVARPHFSIRVWATRFLFACLFALGISAAKLSAVFHFLSHIPRTGYALPQFPAIGDMLNVLFCSLFFSPAWEEAQKSMVNMQFALKRHEFEFGLTFIPLIILGGGVISFLISLRKRRKKVHFPRLGRSGLVSLSIGALLLLLPIALNYYTPAWNRFLKTVPVIASSTQCTRWFCMYIPVLTLLTGVAAVKTPFWRRSHKTIAVAGIAGIIALNLTADKSYYQQESYSPLPIMSTYYKVRWEKWEPAITKIGVCTDRYGRPGISVQRDDSLVVGVSQMWCYDSVFGYGLENLPFKQLEVGSVFKEKNGYLNIKNPACYVFPEVNDCLPGDHFKICEQKKAMAFTHYRPYDFEMTFLQKIANRVTVISLFLAGAFLVFFAGGAGLAFWRQRTGSTKENQT